MCKPSYLCMCVCLPTFFSVLWDVTQRGAVLLRALPCVHASSARHMGSRGPSHAHGPFSTRCFPLRGCSALPIIHQPGLETFTVNHKERLHEAQRIYLGGCTNLYSLSHFPIFCHFFKTEGFHRSKSVVLQ